MNSPSERIVEIDNETETETEGRHASDLRGPWEIVSWRVKLIYGTFLMGRNLEPGFRRPQLLISTAGHI